MANRTGAARTLAEAMGLTAELGDGMAELARRELEAGRPGPARAILEGLVVANPHDAAAWALLARAHRSLGQRLAARFCGEVATSVEPGSMAARLAQAEGLLAFPEERPRARALLGALAAEAGGEADRARALLAAIGPYQDAQRGSAVEVAEK
jgi:thioredoxin-like negative regulator of GroEL